MSDSTQWQLGIVLGIVVIAVAAAIVITIVLLARRIAVQAKASVDAVEVVRQQTTSLPDIASFLKDEHRIATFKIPERLELFEQLPTTGVGKVSKKDLRRIVADRVALANKT